MFHSFKVSRQIRALGGMDHTKRLAAIASLVELGDGRAVDPLVQTLHQLCEPTADGGSRQESVVLRAAAARALGQLANARAIPHLIKASGDTAAEVSDAAKAALLEMHAVEKLIQKLEEEAGPLADSGARTHLAAERADAAEMLGKLGDPQAVHQLIIASEDGSLKVAEAAETALLTMRPVDKLLELFEQYGAVGQAAIAKRLAKIGDRRAVPVLVKALENGKEAAQIAAADALGKLGDNKAVKALLKALETPAPRDKAHTLSSVAAVALGKLGDCEAVPLLTRVLVETKNPYLKVDCCVALGNLGDVTTVETLEREYQKASDMSGSAEQTKAAVRQGLSTLGVRVSGLALGLGDMLTDLDSDAKDVRKAAASALEKLGHPQAGKQQ